MRKWIISLLFFLLLLTLFLPQLASSPLGKPFFARSLSAKTQTRVEIGSLSLSWLGPQTFHHVHWKKEAVEGTIEELQIAAPFWSFSGPFHLKKGTISYAGGQIEEIAGQIEEGHFSLTGSLPGGRLSLQGEVLTPHHFHVDVDIENFPTQVIDPRVEALLGATFSAKGTINLDQPQGKIDLDLFAPYLATTIHGFLKENTLILSEPLTAQIQLTPSLSQLLLKDTNPLFLTAVEAPQPIHLTLRPDSSIPYPFSLGKLSLQGTLDLGQITCRNGQTLSALISLLKTSLPSPYLNIWLTPLTFQLKQGLLETDRLDALVADTIHICSWGKADLIQDELHLTLGLPADTLRRSFGIQNLPENYVLKIPVRGTTQHPEINTKSAAAKIAALFATNEIGKKGLMGEFKGLFGKSKEESAPPPQRPFPWEK